MKVYYEKASVAKEIQNGHLEEKRSTRKFCVGAKAVHKEIGEA